MNIKQEFKEITVLLLESYKADYETTLTEAIDRLGNLEKAITDTRCCTLLKGKEKMSFWSWKQSKGFRYNRMKYIDNDGDYYSMDEVEKMYSNYYDNF